MIGINFAAFTGNGDVFISAEYPSAGQKTITNKTQTNQQVHIHIFLKTLHILLLRYLQRIDIGRPPQRSLSVVTSTADNGMGTAGL